MLNKAFRNKKGITLIALIITIIVLLILAGVTIAAISSNESAPNKAVEARQKNEEGAELDAITLAAVSSVAEGDYNLYVDVPTLRKGLTGLIKGDVNTVIGDNATEWQVEGYKTGRLYKITNRGTVEVLTGVNFKEKTVKIVQGLTGEVEVSNLTGKAITWTSSDTTGKVTVAGKTGEENKAIVTVDSNVTAGTTITITATAGTEHDECTVTITEAVTSISLTKNGSAVTTVEVEEGSTNSEITVTTVPAQGTNVESLQVTSSDETKAIAVIENGVLKITGVAKAEGIVITVSSLANNVSKTVTVKVKEAPLPIGEYVDYAVSYKDMYTDYVFSSTNGWRILDPGTPDGNGGYTGTKIVSTGVPAKVYYHYTTNASTAASTWWGTVAQVRTLYGDTYADAGYDYNNSGYPNCFAAAGMLKNFTSIPFTANTSSPTANNGGYKTITNSDPVTGTTNTTNGSIFITSKAKTTDEVPNSKETATTVHALTQEELNTAINKINGKTSGQSGYRALTSTDSVTSYNLFYLRGLANENSDYLYTSSTSYFYWLASRNTSNANDVRRVDYGGNISINCSNTYGVRPVVSLNSGIYKDGNIWKIK